MHTFKYAAFALALAWATAAHAAAPYPNTDGFGRAADPNAPWFQTCLRVKQVKPPPAPPAPPSCQAFGYYAKRQQATVSAAEWAGVRACAVAADDDAVLAMLYANGLGVARNLDLATQYACRAGGAPAEVEGRIAHLQALKASPAGTRYDQCDDITSGYMMGVCAGIGDSQAEKVRNAYLARLRAQLPKAQVGPYDQLIAATNAFAKARGNETDISGTARGMQVIEAQAREKEWLREHLAAFEKGNFRTTAQPLTVVDAELNRTYRALLAAPASQGNADRLPYSTVTKTDVRAAQRLWLTYRDAWVRFAALRYPSLPPAVLQAMLTDWRVKQFAGIWSAPPAS